MFSRSVIAIAILAMMTSSLVHSDVLHSPIWFTEMMQQKQCVFTKMSYNKGQCKLSLFFNGRFPHYMQIIGLGLNKDLKPDTTAFAKAICVCGAMNVLGTCSPDMINLLTELRGRCGEENVREIPSKDMTKKQWMDREVPRAYSTVRASQPPPGTGDYF